MSFGKNRQIMRSLPLLIALACVFIGDLPVLAQTARWIRFHDPQTGLSFRYPPNLRIRHRDPRKFNLPTVQSIVELIGDTPVNPGTIVLRFLVKRGNTSAADRGKKQELLRRVCKRTSPMVVDRHEAVVCVSKGSGATRWSAEILEPRECTILTLLGGADADQASPPPHDGEFPLLSIIRSVHFSPVSGAAAH
jgi:hypothetical protein